MNSIRSAGLCTSNSYKLYIYPPFETIEQIDYNSIANITLKNWTTEILYISIIKFSILFKLILIFKKKVFLLLQNSIKNISEIFTLINASSEPILVAKTPIWWQKL